MVASDFSDEQGGRTMWTGNASRRPGEDPGTSKLEHVMMVAESPDPSSQVAAGRAAEHEAGPVIGAMGTDRRAVSGWLIHRSARMNIGAARR